VDRLITYETIENPPKVYLLASIYQSDGYWHLWRARIPGTNWTEFSSGALTRYVGISKRPHEMIVANGRVYIKGFPENNFANTAGTIIYDGSGIGAVYHWGLPSPTTPALMFGASGTWDASVDAVSVKIGWKYTYAYKNGYTGHYSTRAPLATDPGSTSDTGAFTNKKPKMVLSSAGGDDSFVTHVGVFRTSDGGGTFYFV
jgi:hypothetical protein